MTVNRFGRGLRGALVFLLFALPAAGGTLRIADAVPGGDTAVRQLALSEALADPALELSIRSSSVGEALRLLASGEVDLVLLERSGVPEEFRGRRMVYAVEALVFYLNSSNPVEGFSQEGVRKLFRAARPVWSEYTLQKETDIQRFAVKPSRPDGLRFRSFFFGDGSRPVGIFELGSAPELVLIVSANPEAVGAALYHPEAPVAVKAAAVDGVAPTLRTVTAGSYPLSFFREALTAEEPPETVRNFLEKLRSSVFYELLYDVGSLPVGDRPDRKKP